jgi:hypothetical protein
MNRSPAERLVRRRLRRGTLVAHVAVSVAWLGAALSLLVLTGGALAAGGDRRAGLYDAGALLGGRLLPVLALAALGTGLACGLLSPFGVLRWWWVVVKLVLTVGLAAATLTLLAARLAEAARLSAAGPVPARVAGQVVVAPAVASVLLLVVTAVAVLKPWGRTRWGRRTMDGADEPAGRSRR